MSENQKTSDLFWKVIVVVLLLIVAVQIYLQNRPRTALPCPDAACSAMTVNPATSSTSPVRPPQASGAAVPVPPLAVAPSPQMPPQGRGMAMLPPPRYRSSADMMREMQAMVDRMMDEMQREMPMHFFGSYPSSDRPLAYGGPVMKEEKDRYVVRLEMPGLSQGNVRARVSGQTLILTGEQREERNNLSGAYGGSVSQFQTSLRLPGPVKADQVKVEYSGNMVTVTVPKA